MNSGAKIVFQPINMQYTKIYIPKSSNRQLQMIKPIIHREFYALALGFTFICQKKKMKEIEYTTTEHHRQFITKPTNILGPKLLLTKACQNNNTSVLYKRCYFLSALYPHEVQKMTLKRFQQLVHLSVESS